MKITKVKHRGQVRYRVNDPHGPDGKRQRKFFDSRDAAENYVEERTADVHAFGVHFTTIPASERASLAYQLQRLASLGWTRYHRNVFGANAASLTWLSSQLPS
ncbi:MAG: hypothetical protein FJ405_07330 [Verrucomicrobia bacterium]|nr:hypothetical protein [Verrucomicrobiota bacterium]